MSFPDPRPCVHMTENIVLSTDVPPEDHSHEVELLHGQCYEYD